MLRSGHIIVLCALALLTVGVVMVNSAEMAVAPIATNADGTSAGIASRGVTFESIVSSTAAMHLVLAMLALIAAALLPIDKIAQLTSRLPRLTPPHYLLGLGVLILLLGLSTVYWPFIANPQNGSHRWITIGPIRSVQPSEPAKWLIIWLAAAYGIWIGRHRLRQFWTGFLPGLAAVGIVSAFVVHEDLGTGVLMASAASIVLLAAGARFWHFALFIPLGLLGIVAAILQNPYRIDRIAAFLNPYVDPQQTGFHMIQSMAAVAGGGFTGRGLGYGLQKFGYLPEDQTDFLFAVICEELGTAGASLILVLYAVLAWTMLAVVRRETDPLLRLGGLGVMSVLTLQATINLVVVTGLGPTKGIALPLLSAGGTGWILTAASLGLMVAMDRRHARAFRGDAAPALALEGSAARTAGPVVRASRP
ncbi:MAG: hypothetical protein DYG94_13360 [Leptolyngbya sp. PLA3]|nr:MAG: hypothetical protein EDM82_13915 [Cyanobacteria bacterium CYA]MCE7969714.1 hypothetical protein [Leptolyngbya sp. PL-A3]